MTARAIDCILGVAAFLQSAYIEREHDEKRVASELARGLRQMQAWLELDAPEVARRGDLAAALRRAVRR